MNAMNGDRKRARFFLVAFTLAEMLAVIAVLSVLAALLLPSLKHARETSNKIKCVNNLRQITMVTLNYCNDNGGDFPLYSTSWMVKQPFIGYLGYSLNDPRLKTHSQILYCPSAEGKPEFFGTTDNWTDTTVQALGGAFGTASLRTCYASNRDAQSLQASNLGQISNRARVLWVADGSSSQFRNGFENLISGYRHGGNPPSSAFSNYIQPGAAGFNSSFLDGHVEWVRWDIFYSFSTNSLHDANFSWY